MFLRETVIRGTENKIELKQKKKQVSKRGNRLLTNKELNFTGMVLKN